MINEQSEKANRAWVLALASVASFMVALDALVVTTALSTIRARPRRLDRGAGMDGERLQPELRGAAADRRRARRPLRAPAHVRRRPRHCSSSASAACALAGSVGWLIAARAVQGAGAALVMPLAMALLSAAFPREERGTALGIFSGVTGLALIAGPVVGRRDRRGPRLAVDLLDQRSDRPRGHSARARVASGRASAPALRSTSPASRW